MLDESTNSISRRQLLKSGSCGFGYLALAGMASHAAAAESKFQSPLAVRAPHHEPKAKRVIFMYMQGGPSHVDTFDYKPALEKLAGKPEPGKGDARKNSGKLLPSPWKFAQHGDSGLYMSELFPHLARHADDLCILNGMHTDNPAHPQATIMLHTGSINFVRPSMGSWIVYGLGSENQDLPGFVTINPVGNLGGTQNYSSAFLPAAYQGTRMITGPDAIANIRNPEWTRKQQRKHLDLVQAMNRDAQQRAPENTEIDGIIQSYELAFRMQDAVPGVMSFADEPQAVKQRYGIGTGATSGFGSQCLMARRLAEAGVRFIQITHKGWDQHNSLKTKLPANCTAIDQPIAALLEDLKQRDMLKDTLVLWGGEFGRTPAEQSNGNGRRHNNRGFSYWLAGGGVQGGMNYGATDEIGSEAAIDKTHIHDLHATILHLFGLDHTKLTYRYAGRDFRLTDVYGNVAHDIIA